MPLVVTGNAFLHTVKGTASTDGYKYARIIKEDHGISHCYVGLSENRVYSQ